MAQDTAIRVCRIGKHFQINPGGARYGTLRDRLAAAASYPYRRVKRVVSRSERESYRDHRRVWALEDISFEVPAGEVIGMIGRNGAGKSTLLKILSRITPPSTGYAELRGRLGSLLEVGTGFHPELTGRENTYLSGTILGMTRGEVSARFDEIVDFAGIAKFIDTPVKHYSSGMYLRLAFAVAAHLEPEILLVDEVLAVGDAEFQKKCLGKMGEAAKGGRTIVFVSHNMAAVARLCSQVVWLDKGRMVESGAVDDVIGRYLRAAEHSAQQDLATRDDRSGDGRLRFTELNLLSPDGTQLDAVTSGRPFQLAVRYRCEADITAQPLKFDVGLYDSLGQIVTTLSNRITGDDVLAEDGQGEVVCEVPELALAPGTYSLSLWCDLRGTALDFIRDAASLQVLSKETPSGGEPPKRRMHGAYAPRQLWHAAAPSASCVAESAAYRAGS